MIPTPTLEHAVPARLRLALLPLAFLLYLPLPSVAGPPVQRIYATGLAGPVKVDMAPSGRRLIVSERGTGANDGRLSLIDRYGNPRPIVSGLPSGIEPTNAPSGPQGVLMRGCCMVEITIGEGDTLRFDGPPREVPNPLGTASPLFSSVVQFVFDRPVEDLTAGFELAAAEHATLSDGQTVRLENLSGEKAWVRLAADFKDFRPDPLINVRASNPFALTDDEDRFGTLLVDAGQNSVVQVGAFGPPKTVLRFAGVPNAPGVLPPMSDAVPTSIRHYRGSKYLVSLLTGTPFAAGSASVRLVDTEKRTESTLLSGLTTATDVLVVGPHIYVLEISSNLQQGLPGRLLRFSSPAAQPEVIATGLIGASGMAYSAKRRAIYITEVFAGRITEVSF